MGKSIARSVAVIVALGWLLAACSGSKGTTGGNGGSGGGGGSSGNASFCVAGAKRCDGLNVKICDDAGSKETIAQTCLPSQPCSDGACGGSRCLPNSEFCQDGAVWKCDESGAGTLAQQCATGLFCLAEGERASCSTQACAASLPVCDGDVATRCESDGSGPTSGGVDCAKNEQACYGGQCREIACSNGTKLCEHGDVYLCSRNGTDIALLTDCNPSEVCDADTGSCRAKLCDAGKVSCDGTRIQSCNAYGSAWLPGALDCAADGKICVGGSCRKQICAPSRSYCQDDSAYNCDSTGTVSTLTQTCDTRFEYCATASGSCKKYECHAGDTVCSGNVIKVCNADGTLPVGGTPCGASQFCENAQCKDLECVPGAYFCQGADVYYCDFNGPHLSQQCDADTSCSTLGSSGATCAPRICAPSSSACLGNQIGICASNGQSLSQVTNDCTSTTSVCTQDLKCAKSASDTVGVSENAEPISASTVFGDVIEVDSARTLTELQMQLVLAGPRELRWIVYEQSGQNFVPKIDKLVSSPAGSGFIGSGPLSFKLGAGKRYLFALVISGGDAVAYLDTLPFSGRVSFGAVIGRVISFYPGSFDVFSLDPNYLSQMKLTTEAP